MKTNFCWNILNEKQKTVLNNLSFLNKYEFYLAGGTSLALHFGHRTSLDFDFYSPHEFNSTDLWNDIEKQFGIDTKATVMEKNTVFCEIKGVKASFFLYKYKILNKPLLTKSVIIADIPDIAAMKMIAVIQRPATRDYIDMSYLIERFSLKKIFLWSRKKYKNFNEYLALRALTYFDDLKEESGTRIKMLDKNFSWKKAKKTIEEEVKKYQINMLEWKK